MRKTIHLVQKDVVPMKCLICSAVTPIIKKTKKSNILNGPAVCYNRDDWNTIYVDNKDFRRCIDPPDPIQKPTYATPTEKGFYFAEWRVAEDNTPPQEDATPLFNAEVVEVFVHDTSEEDVKLRVNLFGVSVSQSLDCFVWRSAKLKPPKE